MMVAYASFLVTPFATISNYIALCPREVNALSFSITELFEHRLFDKQFTYWTTCMYQITGGEASVIAHEVIVKAQAFYCFFLASLLFDSLM